MNGLCCSYLTGVHYRAAAGRIKRKLRSEFRDDDASGTMPDMCCINAGLKIAQR